METETKINFVGYILAILLTGIAMVIGSIIFPPIGLVLWGLLIIAGIVGMSK
jgi:hypothetical protein